MTTLEAQVALLVSSIPQAPNLNEEVPMAKKRATKKKATKKKAAKKTRRKKASKK